MKDPIDSRQLTIFLTLARKGSLRAAAADLFLTSSAVSHSIHALEESLGVKRFDRPGKWLELTDKGRVLEKEAAEILQMMERVRATLANPETLQHQPLRVAVGNSFLRYLLPDVMREWQQCFPKGKLIPRASIRDDCVQMVASGEADVAVIADPPDDPAYVVHPLFEDELRVVASASSSLAKLDLVPLRSLHGRNLYVNRLQSHTTKRILAEMRRLGLSFHEVLEMGSAESVYEMVKIGGGVSLQPEWIWQRHANEDGLLSRPLAQVRLIRRWAYIRRADKPAGLMDRTFLRLCQRVAENVCGYVASA